MDKVVIFGAGGTGKILQEKLLHDKNLEVIAFIDSDSNKVGNKINGIKIYSIHELLSLQFDKVILGSTSGLDEMRMQLLEKGVSENYIISDFIENEAKSRILCLKNISKVIYHRKINGAVGEAGVFRGEFAKYINVFFPDRECYLFDTFEGFDDRDYEYEIEKSDSSIFEQHFKGTSVDLVLNKMKHKENCKIYKGYFPESAKEILDVSFCFVSLDMDLYKPMLEGLRYFFSKLEEGGGNISA